jgi:hypothetical protein
LWHIEQLLGNDRKKNNAIMAIALQQHRKYATVIETLLESGPRATMVVLLEAVSSVDEHYSLRMNKDTKNIMKTNRV